MNLTLQMRKLSGEYREKIRLKLREKAILRTKARLIENRIEIDELSDEEIEVVIKDEEDKILDEYKTKGIIALLALLGISWI